MAEIVVTKELVENLAKYARLLLTPEETTKYAQQLSVILDAFRELDQVDTNGIDPSYHPIELEDALREDESKKWRWDPLSNVLGKKEQHIRGPKIK